MFPFLKVNFKFEPWMITSGFFENFMNNALFQSVVAVPAISATATVILPQHGKRTDHLLAITA